MITVIFGPNAYRRDEAVADIVDSHIAKHSADTISRFDAVDSEWAIIDNALISTSLFSSGDQLVIVRSASGVAHVRDQLQERFEGLAEDTSLVLLEPAIDKRTTFFKQLKKSANLIECKVLRDFELERWVQERANELDIELGRGVQRGLVARVGTDQLRLEHELRKLANHEGVVTQAVIERVVAAAPQDNIFALLDATVQGDTKSAMQLYDGLIQAKTEPIYMLTMLGWQAYNIAVVQAAGEQTDASIAKEAGISPFVVSKTRQIARRLSRADVQHLVDIIARADIAIKTTPVDGGQLVRQVVLDVVATVKS